VEKEAMKLEGTRIKLEHKKDVLMEREKRKRMEADTNMKREENESKRLKNMLETMETIMGMKKAASGDNNI
jgi:hypothetical protein